MTHRSLLPDAVDAYLHNEAHTETPLSRRLRNPRHFFNQQRSFRYSEATQ